MTLEVHGVESLGTGQKVRSAEAGRGGGGSSGARTMAGKAFVIMCQSTRFREGRRARRMASEGQGAECQL